MDTLHGMRVYASVVEAGSFSGGAERLGISKALASKYVGQLEERLGARLLHRTTRRLSPTEIGQAYYEHCVRLLDDLDSVEASVRSQHLQPRGHLRVSGPRIFGEDLLVDCVQDFLGRYPEISVDLVLEERTVDLVAEGFDVAVRIGALADSGLIARRLMPYRYVLCATPGYLAAHCMPERPGDLRGHACVVNSVISPANQWRFLVDGQPTQITVAARIRVNSGRAVRALVLADHGIGLCLLPSVADDLEAGRLVRVLEPFEGYERTVHAVYPASRHLSAKVRVFIDHLVATFAERS